MLQQVGGVDGLDGTHRLFSAKASPTQAGLGMDDNHGREREAVIELGISRWKQGVARLRLDLCVREFIDDALDLAGLPWLRAEERAGSVLRESEHLKNAATEL